MAGVRTIEELLKLDDQLYDITIIGSEAYPNYNRILLSPVLTGEQTIQDIILNDQSWYDNNRIHLMMNQSVTTVDRVRRQVHTTDGTVVPYDRLLLATGSNPFILPVPGHTLDGVVTFRDINDVNLMIEAAGVRRHAVVIGGGLLGLEAANGLAVRGMTVTVVHLGDTLLDRQLDSQAANMLRASLEARGLQFLMAHQTSEIVDDGNGRVGGDPFCQWP